MALKCTCISEQRAYSTYISYRVSDKQLISDTDVRELVMALALKILIRASFKNKRIAIHNKSNIGKIYSGIPAAYYRTVEIKPHH